MVKIRKDLTGKTFGRLKVIERADDYISPSGHRHSMWRCKCSCPEGNVVIVDTHALNNGSTKSCGCLRNELSANRCKKTNDYEIQEDYVIMYTLKGEPFLVDLEDFWRVKDICWHKNDNGYLIGWVNGKSIRLHRFIMNAPDNLLVDHRYGKETRNDNRKYNLRLATNSQNNANRPRQENNTSGTTGVHKDKWCNKWRARVWQNNRTVYLGIFDTKEEAIEARKKAENEYYGEFSYDNSQKTQLFLLPVKENQ